MQDTERHKTPRRRSSKTSSQLPDLEPLRSEITRVDEQNSRPADQDATGALRSLYQAVETMQLGVTVTDVYGRITYTNQAEADMHGYLRDEIIGQTVKIFAPAELADPMTPERIREMKRWYRESVNVRKDGTRFPVLLRSDAVLNEAGEPVGIITTCEDITERKKASQDLERSYSILRATLESTADGILVVDLDGNILARNGKFQEMWGISSEIMESTSYATEVFMSALTQLKDPDSFMKTTRRLYSNPEERSTDVLEFNDGRFLEQYSIPQQMGGTIVGRIWSYRDVTDRRLAEKRLEHDAFHDPLTGLSNRALFMDRLGVILAKRRRYYLFALLFLDLDWFKIINDSLGHIVGDQLLISTARKLESCLRPGDTVARFGGDEFAVLLDEIKDITDAVRIAERIQKELSTPVKLGGHDISTSASIGIALGATGYDSPEDLLQDADTAMYRAKSLGKARQEVFDKEMQSRAVAIMKLETDLRTAVERQQFELYYQPIVSLGSGLVTGFEALLRWNHPDRGLVYPAEFLAMTEETGLIIPLGRLVLIQACRQMRAWQSRFPAARRLCVSVNLSAKQFSHRELCSEISQTLTETHLEASSLQLEIPESVLMQNAETSGGILQKLKAMNVKLFIDNFGTGYSSFSFLHRFPFDKLKIDRTFITRMDQDPEAAENVRGLLELARNLDKSVIAQGIETAAQLKTLRDLDCAEGQGYHFSRPVESEAAENFLTRTRW